MDVSESHTSLTQIYLAYFPFLVNTFSGWNLFQTFSRNFAGKKENENVLLIIFGELQVVTGKQVIYQINSNQSQSHLRGEM